MLSFHNGYRALVEQIDGPFPVYQHGLFVRYRLRLLMVAPGILVPVIVNSR